MLHEIRLFTNHLGARALIGDWLSEARLALPAPVDLVIDVGPVLVPPAGSERPPVFSQGRVDIRGYPHQAVTLDWGAGLGRAVLAPGGVIAHVTITEESMTESNELLRSFLLNVCILLVRRVGLHHVHGATLRDPSDRGWLIVGESGSGKSTTTVLLAKNGWTVSTDDISFLIAGIAPNTTDMIGWRERLALRDDAVATTGHVGGTALSTRRKTGWFAEELGTGWVSRVSPAVIAFPSVSAATPTAVRPIGATEALTRILDSSPWVMLEREYADEHLGLMTQLVKQARAFEITLGRDLFDHPEYLLERVA